MSNCCRKAFPIRLQGPWRTCTPRSSCCWAITHTFTRTDQWQSEAQYLVGGSLICRFRQDSKRDGEVEFVLYFGANVGQPVRTLFQSLVESFLDRPNLSVSRFNPVVCPERHLLNRTVVRDQLRARKQFAFCPECGQKVVLPRPDEPIHLAESERRKVDDKVRFAGRRSVFEQALFQLSSYVESGKLERPECFISYAWGDRDSELWVERNLATDLQKAGISVVLDRWENAGSARACRGSWIGLRSATVLLWSGHRSTDQSTRTRRQSPPVTSSRRK